MCSIRGEAEKRRLLLQQLDKAGEQQLMRGRVRWGQRCPAARSLAMAACCRQAPCMPCMCATQESSLGVRVTRSPTRCSVPCSSMLHGAMRQAEESKLGRERYGDRGSAGQYITRTKPHE